MRLQLFPSILKSNFRVKCENDRHFFLKTLPRSRCVAGKRRFCVRRACALQCAARRPHFNEPAALLAHFETENGTGGGSHLTSQQALDTVDRIRVSCARFEMCVLVCLCVLPLYTYIPTDDTEPNSHYLSGSLFNRKYKYKQAPEPIATHSTTQTR